MENIERLSRIPEGLLKAYNVAYIVIDGLRLDKKLMIEKAQREAKVFLACKEYLSKEGEQKLQAILDL